MKKSTLKNFSWIVIANAVSSFAKWLIIILIAKNLSVKEVGEYSLAFTVSAPITLFAQMKLRSIFVTETSIDFNNYLFVRKYSNITTVLILFLISYFLYENYILIIIFVGLSKVLDLYSDMYYAYPHKENNLDLVGKFLVAKSLLFLLIFSISIVISKNLLISYAIMLIVQMVFVFSVEKKYIERKFDILKKNIDYQSVKKLLRMGLPLGFVAMVYSFTVNLPRYVLEYFESPVILGYFSAIMYIVTISNLFQIAISQIFLPKLSRLYNNRDYSMFKKHLWKQLMLASLIIGTILIAVVWNFGEEILVMLYGTDYANYSNILNMAIISVVINMISGNLDTALIATKTIKSQPTILVINLLITSLLSFYSIKNWGITGAAYTLIFSNSILLILRFGILYRKTNNLNNKYYES